MIPLELLRKVRKIHITTSRMVTDAFAGHYQSVFKGKGIEFDEVREYLPGDDIRTIDWNVTARMGYPYVKKFVEERELTVIFLLDLSLSCHFGTVNQLKSQLAAELCALLSFSAIKNHDRVGLVAFTDRVEKFIPPGKGVQHVLRMVRDALFFRPESKGTNIPLALEYLNRLFPRKTLTFILSDFYPANFQKPLSIVSKRHDIVAISLVDPLELNLPRVGLMQLEDAETGQTFLVDTSHEKSRESYMRMAREIGEERKKLFRSIPIDHIDIRTDVPYLPALINFFRMRERRFSH
jgi:uncharacterized protein (DUF58 family)